MTKFLAARNEATWDGISFLLELEEKNYIFIGNCCVYTFETEDKIIKFTSNVGNNSLPYAVAYGERNICYMCDVISRYTIWIYTRWCVQKKLEMDEFLNLMLLYESTGGEKIKNYSLNLVAPRFVDD